MQIATVSKWLEQLTLSDIGSIASLVGLALTIWVAMAVRRIKARFMITARVPDLAKSLRQHATKLSGFLSDPVAFHHQIHEELAAAEVTAHSLKTKLSGHPRGMVKVLLGDIRKRARDDKAGPELRELYLQMVRVNEQLRDMRKDLKWER